MNMKIFVRVSFGVLWLGLVLADGVGRADEPDLSILKHDPSSAASPPSAMLRRYLLGRAERFFEARDREVAGLKTEAEIRARQDRLRAFFWKSLGDLPERTPLHAQVVKTIPREGYRIELVIFESRPRHHVTAALYLPEASGKVPGVLVPCGHAASGKAEASYQQICQMLARAGCAAFCYDPIGQGERLQILDRSGKPIVQNTDEHTLEGIGALLVGRQTASYRIWDGLRALDYLESRPEVDAHRLGCTGNSGGGTLTAYLMTLDDRILAGAPSCYITSFERLFATIGPQDAEQNITGQVAAGLNHADYLTIRAPRPTLLTVGTRDFFDIDGSWRSFREAKLLYGKLGRGECVDLFESDEPHGFTRPRRVATVRFMRRWLAGKDDAFDAADAVPLGDKDLQCTRTGQVLRDFADDSVPDLNARRAHELAAGRMQRGVLAASELRGRVAARLGLDQGGRSPQPIPPRAAGELDDKGFHLRKWVYETEPGVLVPVLEASVPGSGGGVRLVVGGSWREVLAGLAAEKGGPARTLLVAPRGMGETEPDGRGGAFLGADWQEAFLGLHLGRPLLGLRVYDVLSVLESVRSATGGGVELWGMGAGGVVVMHAAVLAEKGSIIRLHLGGSLVSWGDVVERGVSKGMLASVVPGVLEDYDLPELVAGLAPLPLEIVSPRDAVGDPLDERAIESAYAACRKAYGSGASLAITR